MEMKCFGDCFRGRSVLLTGHTGFKGSWLTLLLQALGARVTGIALPPEVSPSHWELLGLDIEEHRLDIRDADALHRAVVEARPEVVFHLAAQSLVRRSYREPLETWSTNVTGTANLLDACRRIPTVRVIVVVTTDKCYENREWPWGYREIDPLGGRDPYSASKAAAELVASSYRASFFQGEGAALVATARAGNVIGGGDWSEDRLIPDLVKGLREGKPAPIRFPNSTRPWQHVLDPLSGYLRLSQLLLHGSRALADAWNFGPDPEGNRTVREMLGRLQHHWPALSWRIDQDPQAHESSLLYIDASKARKDLGWRPVYSFEDSVRLTADWYRKFQETGTVASQRQVEEYLSAAADAGVSWCAG
jgi:CDP-glucose 4,6-dehydratase